MENKFIVSPSPHLRHRDNTQRIMLDVIIALVPALIASTIIFGYRSLLVTAVCVLSCVLSEFISRKVMKRGNTISDLSAVVTGILLAFNMPVNINLAIAAFGGVVAIVVVKQMFGGIGYNFVNPAITARIVLLFSFPTHMSAWTAAFSSNYGADAVSVATPLGEKASQIGYLDLFLGNHGGCLGETCALALLLGGLYLIIRRVIKPTIPLCFIGTVFVLSFVLGEDPVFHILSGGVMLGAIFMATDYVTSPMTFWGKVIFAVGCGVITVLIRVYGSLPEGVSFSIILMNILTPLIERGTVPKYFGKKKKEAE